MAKQEVGKKIEEGRDDDVEYCKLLLEAAKNEDIEIYTSMLTVAECTHAGQDVSDDVKNLFRGILTSGQYVVLVQPDIFVAEKARDLRWNHDIRLSGVDGIHVASALDMGCSEFLTNDRLIKKDDKAKIEALGLKIILPKDTKELPEKYRQRDITDAEIVEESGDE